MLEWVNLDDNVREKDIPTTERVLHHQNAASPHNNSWQVRWWWQTIRTSVNWASMTKEMLFHSHSFQRWPFQWTFFFCTICTHCQNDKFWLIIISAPRLVNTFIKSVDTKSFYLLKKSQLWNIWHYHKISSSNYPHWFHYFTVSTKLILERVQKLFSFWCVKWS